MKATRIRDSCIARIKFMNEIQCIVTKRNHCCVVIYFFGFHVC